MFISPAFAQTHSASSAGTTEVILQLVPFGIVFVIMYLLVLRPQQQRAQRMRDMIADIKRGDMIITTGGLIGKVSKLIDDAEIELEIAPDVRIRLLRSAIAEKREK